MEQMYNYGYVLTAVAVMALVTYIPRMIPLTFMRKKLPADLCVRFCIICRMRY